jgi:hypothetical protein
MALPPAALPPIDAPPLLNEPLEVECPPLELAAELEECVAMDEWLPAGMVWVAVPFPAIRLSFPCDRVPGVDEM